MPAPAKPSKRDREPSIGDIASRLPEAEFSPPGVREEGLSLSPSVGVPVQPVPSDPVALQYQRERQYAAQPTPNDPILLERQRQMPRYQPVPGDPILLERQASRTLQSLLASGEASWWDTTKIAIELRAAVEAPQAAELARAQETIEPLARPNFYSDNYNEYSGVGIEEAQAKEDRVQVDLDRNSAQWLLDNPDFIERYANAYWSHIMSTPVTAIEGYGQIPGTDLDVVTNMTASLFKKHQNILTPDQVKFIVGNLALQPDDDQMAIDRGVRLNHNTGWEWIPGQIVENWDWLWKAPGNFRGHINDPREQTIALLDAFLSETGSLDTLEEKGRFADLITSQTYGAIMDVSNNDSGILGFMDVAFGGPFTITGNAANEWIYRAANPNDYINKEAFSLGQTGAIWIGQDPSADYFRQTSGIIDLQANLSPLDPINVMAAFGSGLANAARIPRIARVASKADDIAQVAGKGHYFRSIFNPRSAKFKNLPLLDSGPMGRFFYTTFSKTTDQMFDGRRFQKWARAVAKLDSVTEIEQMSPTLQGSHKLLNRLARAETPEEVIYYMKQGLYAPAHNGFENTWEGVRTQDQLSAEAGRYRATQRNDLAENRSLGDLGEVDSVQVVLTPEGYLGDIVSGRRAADLADPDTPGAVIPADRAAVRDMVDRGRTNAGELDDFEKGLGGVRRNVGTVTSPKTGEQFRIQYDTSGFGEYSYLAYADDGTPMGGVAVVDDEIKMGLDEPARGVMDQIWDIARGNDDDLILLHGRSDSTTEDAIRFNKRYAEKLLLDPTYTGNAGLFAKSELVEDGSTKAVVSYTSGTENIVRLDDNVSDMAEWLYDVGLADDAALVMMDASVGRNIRFADLSPEAQSRLGEYVATRGGTVGIYGENVVMTEGAIRRTLLIGDDVAGEAGALAARNPKAVEAVTNARLEFHAVRRAYDPKLWMVADPAISLPNWTKRLRSMTSNSSTSGTMQALRRLGFTMTNTLPTNIRLSDPGVGARALHKWIKFLGGTDEKAIFWAEKFREGNVGNRWEIVFDAFEDLGKEIRNPMIRDGLIQFNEKSKLGFGIGDRQGNPLGLVPDTGRVRPVTISQLTDSFVMPNPHELKQSVKRYNTAKKLPTRFKRGLLAPSTQRNREQIADRLAAKMKRVYGIDNVPKEDLLAMAYADVVGGEYGRANGLGILAKSVAGFNSKVFQPFHDLFVISQLAGRPISWTSRVLLEESFRAEMFGLPSLWRNQYDYAWDMWDAHGIRALPKLLDAQSRQVDEIVNELFVSGFSMRKAKEVIPDIEDVLRKARIGTNDPERLRTFIANAIGRELSVASGEKIGSDMNLPMSAVRRSRKINKTYAQMARDGIHDQFRWNIDGEAIANRSVWNSFLDEAETARIPIEWSPGHMSRQQIRTYGYSWGKTTFNQLHDPLTGTFGINRALDSSLGRETKYTAERLMRSEQWTKLRHIVDEITQGHGLNLNEVQKAEWYLRNITDEIVASLIDPLAKGDRAERARILTEYNDTKKLRVTLSGREHVLDASRANYTGFVEGSRELAEDAYLEGINMPSKLGAFTDARFGQKVHADTLVGKARKATDWVMDVAGERPTQYLHRQPAFKHIHGKWYRYYKDMGWEDEAAMLASSRKSAELVNYIFFDNKNIPMFLKSMNQYVPFFSAMWEVSSTWLYKIPSVDLLPIGYMHMGRRVQRTIRALQQSGLVSVDPDTDQMTLMLTDDMNHAQPLAAGIGSAMFKLADAPRQGIQHLAGLAHFAAGNWDEGYSPKDYSQWAKDGYQFSIGNPLDPTSFGIMAVNQFSAGFTPLFQYPAGLAASALFSVDDEKLDTEGKTAAQVLEDRPDLDIGQIIRYNEEALRAVNGDEVFNRAVAYDWDIEQLKMPDKIVLPHTSLWETLVDSIWFPYGRANSFDDIGQTLYSVTPSAMSYIIRGLNHNFVPDEYGDWLEFFVGSQAMASVDAEVLSQLQIEEAETGNISRELRIVTEANRIIEDIGFEIATEDGGNARRILNPEVDESAANRVRELWDEASRLNTQTISRANNRAGGSVFLRGFMGMLGPATPRMFDQNQEQIAAYWAAKGVAEEAVETGKLDFSSGIVQGNIRTPEDMVRYATLVDQWLSDPSGDDAKIWLSQNYPGLRMYTSGKTFWGANGPPVYAEGFDEYNEQIESGEREVFEPEVYMARYWRSGISVDREIAVREEYGTDPVEAAQAILADQSRYNSIIEDYNAAYDAIDFIDAHLFDSKYQIYRTKKLDNLSVYEAIEEKIRAIQESVDTIQASLDYGALDPAERRQLLGYQQAAAFQQRTLINELRQFEEDNPIYRNPRQQLVDSYYDTIKDPYREDIGRVLAKLDDAKSKAEVSAIWEEKRKVEDKWYARDLELRGFDGEPFAVPPPQVHTWNSRPQNEMQERILSIVTKKPQWLSKFEADVLVQQSPNAARVYPVTAEQREIYVWAEEQKAEARSAFLADPNAKRSQYEQQLYDIDDEVDKYLLENDRDEELRFKEAVPIQKLDVLGLLPGSLDGLIPVINQTITDLEKIEKSPTSNEGYRAFRAVKNWFVNDYAAVNPTAVSDLKELAWAMYGTKVDSSVMAHLFQGDQFDDLE